MASDVVAALQPTALMLWLPLGDSKIPKLSHLYTENAAQTVGPSVVLLHVAPRRRHRGFSTVPFASLLRLGDNIPHIRALELRSVVLQPDTFQGAPTPLPLFALLESLTIVPELVHVPGKSPITTALFLLFPHMPHLRSLTVYASRTRPPYEIDYGLSYPDLPFSLKRFSCLGGIAVRACARIIACSLGNLDEMKISVDRDLTDADEARLLAAIAQAAPGLRSFDLRLRADHVPWMRVKTVFVALARVQTLLLEAPLTLHDALALIGPQVSLRELTILCTRSFTPLTSVELPVYLLQTPLLRKVTLRRFDDGDEERDALRELCRARRIRCRISF